MNEQQEAEALRAPGEDVDGLAAVRLEMTEEIRGLVRQVIREHLQREADPVLHHAVEGGRPGKPRYATTRLEHDLFALLCTIGPYAPPGQLQYAVTDADHHRVIAETCTQLGHPTTPKKVKDRLARGRKYAREHPNSQGPPVHAGVSASEHAQKVRKNIALYSPRGRK